MTINQCKLCKKPFNTAGTGAKFCTECLRQIEKDFFVVKDFIYDNKGADIGAISKGTGVDKIVIQHLIREGRFYYEDVHAESAGVYKCKICGKPAGSDKICRDCKSNLAASMQSQMEKNRQQKEPAQPQSALTKGIGMHSRRNVK